MSNFPKEIRNLVEKHKKLATSPIKIWRMPEKGKQYVIGADPCLGNDEDSNAAIQIIDVETGEQCAEYAAVISPEKLAPIIFDLGNLYNAAEVAVEVNSVGMVTNSILMKKLEYEHLYRYERLGSRTAAGTEIFGWWTDYKTKVRMESAFQHFFASTPELIHSKKLLEEILSYTEDSTEPDDRLVAMMIALTVRSEKSLVAVG